MPYSILFEQFILIWWVNIAQRSRLIKTAKFINMQRFKLPKQHVTMTMNVIVFTIFVAKVEAGILVKALALETQQ